MATPASNTSLSVPQDTLGFLERAIATFEGINQLAELMAKMGTMPKHLVGKPADCFRIVVQAAKWKMDPFAVAECTSLVHGRMCYEGKLIAAALYSLGAIEGRLRYEITGKGQAAEITITGTPRGGELVSLHGSVKDWRTHGDGSPWDKQPEDQLIYRGTRQWTRRYAPEALLGVYAPDEMEEIREVEATVRRDPEPARTGTASAPAPTEPPKEKPAEKAPAPAPHPALAASRDLYKALNAIEKGLGKKITDRLCALQGAADPLSVAPEKLDQFAKDVAEIAALATDRPRFEDLLSQWEHAAKEAQP